MPSAGTKTQGYYGSTYFMNQSGTISRMINVYFRVDMLDIMKKLNGS